ncbi:coproporphyrinogen oxidase [Perkinsela sp. CCAP 1560/4]|nr:coproporphyrinogen oxidase [Perkinsela sp. CCAP 1560/4]|eukprot:KNH09619.1 coproporphyrinogen oxidase [Perkinsela sp. CCAP 1560/4]
MFSQAREFFQGLQSEICEKLEHFENGLVKFGKDEWGKEDGFGRGISRVLKGGKIFEQAGVNWSQMTGAQLPPSVLAKYPDLQGGKFFVTGISLIVHPRNPYCPTVHANYRFFQVMSPVDEEKVVKWWFGGGMDLTPYYLFEADACFLHGSLKMTCDKFHKDYFEVFSSWANKYFYIKHRREHRGIGGLFFDYLSSDLDKEPLYRASMGSFEYSEELKELSDNLFSRNVGSASPGSFDSVFQFVKECGELFLPIYCQIIERREKFTYTEENREWQLYRRGRYVEFNLVYDRGTVFGLQTGGRVESILMSLPPLVRFEYDYCPRKGSGDDQLLQVLREPVEWYRHCCHHVALDHYISD